MPVILFTFAELKVCCGQFLRFFFFYYLFIYFLFFGPFIETFLAIDEVMRIMHDPPDLSRCVCQLFRLFSPGLELPRGFELDTRFSVCFNSAGSTCLRVHIEVNLVVFLVLQCLLRVATCVASLSAYLKAIDSLSTERKSLHLSLKRKPYVGAKW